MKKLTKKIITGIFFCLCFAIIACNAQVPREAWMNKSSLVFKAEVLLLQTSTINWNDPGDLGVLKLTEIFKGEKELSDFLNGQITVKFNNIEKVKKGQTLIIYGNTWLINEGIAIAEIEHEILGEKNLTNDNYKDEMKKSMQVAKSLQIKERAAKADAVFSFTVMSTRKLQENNQRISEHNPEWMLADLKINESMKGDNKAGSIVTIAFPGSKDVMWIDAPRFKEGNSFILFLSKENSAFKDVKQLIVTSPEQLWDAREINIVRTALR